MIEILYRTGEKEYLPDQTELESIAKGKLRPVLVIRETNGEISFKPLDSVKEIYAV